MKKTIIVLALCVAVSAQAAWRHAGGAKAAPKSTINEGSNPPGNTGGATSLAQAVQAAANGPQSAAYATCVQNFVNCLQGINDQHATVLVDYINGVNG
jgi:hypothetical protein